MAADSKPATARIRKVFALLDSDQAGEVRAAGHALRRLLGADPAALEATGTKGPEHVPERHELEACLAYAAEAIAELTREIEGLRRDNLALRERAPNPAAAPAAAWWPGAGRPPQGTPSPRPRTAH
jgi:hypothetical protein